MVTADAPVPPDATVRWTPRFPTDVTLTLGRAQQGRRDPTQRSTQAGAIWRTIRTATGPATARFDRIGDELRCLAWGDGAAIVVERAADLLGGSDDPSGFVPQHPFLDAAHHRFPGLRIAGTGDVLHGLIGAVLEQRVQGVEAMGAWVRLVGRLGAPAPGPAPDGMRVFPDGKAWLGIPQWEWRAAGVDDRRAAVVRRVAALDASLQRLVERTAEERGAALRSMPGVGPWTRAEVRQRVLGDADAVSVGDFHLAKIVGSVLGDGPLTDAALLPFLEPWRPHRYRVARLLYASGIESLPRHAPRAPIR